jgi:hypothetical protein
MPAVRPEGAPEGDYEAFYDFARRSLAAGPPRDAKLMLLLARAESSLAGWTTRGAPWNAWQGWA